jgi:hypothetical protein
LAEILQGFRRDEQADWVASSLKGLHDLEPTWDDWRVAAKRIQFARQFMHDAVDWKIIDENPFCKVKTQKSSVKANEFVPRDVVDKLMKKPTPFGK